MRRQEYDEIEAVWNRALALGGTLRFSVCHERSVFCEFGALSLSADTVSFTMGKDVVFSVPTKEVVAETMGQPQDISAHFFRIQAGGKTHNFYFVPQWGGCSEQPASVVVCPGAGYTQQKAITEFVMQALQKINAGTLTKIKNQDETKPKISH